MIQHARAAVRLAALVLAAASTFAQDRTGTVRVQVVPDRPGWTYAIGEDARFRITVTRDGHPLAGVPVTYTLGLERMPPREEKTLPVPAEGLEVKSAGLTQPGFLRVVATAKVEGQEYRGLATAGYAPDRIEPTIPEPADFDAFWETGRKALAEVPVDAKLTPLPSSSTARADCYHVSLQNVPIEGSNQSRVYGVLCEPKGDGPFPALLNVPGAGVRGYRGNVELAEKGIITFQIGIHGIPVNLDGPVYDDLRAAALSGYNVFNLDDRDRYYYRRVYLGCLRANDFLASRPRYDGRTLGVAGGSQGGALSIVTAGLDPRVKVVGAFYPALADMTGYLHGRTGGWPHMFQDEKRHRSPEKILTAAYYDVVNFARRVRVPGLYSWGYNDETCPPTSMHAAYNVIPAEKSLLLALEMGHTQDPEQTGRMNAWLEEAQGPVGRSGSAGGTGLTKGQAPGRRLARGVDRLLARLPVRLGLKVPRAAPAVCPGAGRFPRGRHAALRQPAHGSLRGRRGQRHPEEHHRRHGRFERRPLLVRRHDARHRGRQRDNVVTDVSAIARSVSGRSLTGVLAVPPQCPAAPRA